MGDFYKKNDAIEEIVKLIQEEEDKERAMAFTNRVCSLFIENGIKANIRENKYIDPSDITQFSVKKEYFVDSLDFTEHDKPYKNEIKELKEQIKELEAELETKDNLLKIKNGLTGDNEDTPIAVAKEIIGNYLESDVEQIKRHLDVYLERMVF